MKKKTKVKGSAQYVLPAVALAPLLAFTGPFGLLAYPLLVLAAKKGIREDLEKKHSRSTQTVASHWEHMRPNKKHFRVSTTEFTDGVFPLSGTLEHTFTRDSNNTEARIAHAIRRNSHFTEGTIGLAFEKGVEDLFD